MNCTNCGKLMNVNEQYCSQCGTLNNGGVNQAQMASNNGINNTIGQVNTSTPVTENPVDSTGMNAANEGKATKGLILGIIGLATCWASIIGGTIAIIGLIFSTKGLKSLKRGSAVAGIILSSIALLAAIIIFIWSVRAILSKNSPFTKTLNQAMQQANTTTNPRTLNSGATNQNTSSNKLNSQPYINYLHGFKINAPLDWQIDESGQTGAVVFFSNKQYDGVGQALKQASIDVAIGETYGADLDKYVSAIKEVTPKAFPGTKVINEKAVTINGLDGKMIFMTYPDPSPTIQIELKAAQFITVKNNKGYILSAVAIGSVWDKYEDLFMTSFSTFSVN